MKPDAAAADRRRKPRVALPREVVALTDDASQVRFALVGCDLSMEGIRVEPHPSLVLDERLDLALYDGVDADPAVLRALVARDDGPRGCWLRFAALDVTTRARIVRIIASGAALESVGESEAESIYMIQGRADRKRG